MSQAERNAAAEDMVRHGRILRGARNDVRRGDWVQWSWPRELHMGLVVRAARGGSWADVWHSSSLAMRRDGYPPEECHMVRRLRASTMQVIWETPRA